MCGIVAMLSSVNEATKRLDSSSAFPRPDARRLDDLNAALAEIDFPLIYLVTSDSDAYVRWQTTAAELQRGDGDPAGAEQRLRRDLAWRIEHDLLGLADALSALLRDPRRQASPQALWLAWQSELALRAIGRLEVRGRDSAGLSVLLWMGDEGVAADLAATCPPVETEGEVFAERQVVAGTDCLLLTYKVAEEIGALGFNESTMRDLLTRDRCFQRAVRAKPGHALILVHTRWASNGLINIDNAHPVDGFLEPLEDGGFGTPPGRTLSVVNGDVDNYQSIARAIQDRAGIPDGVTTDAKALPALIELGEADGKTIDESLAAAMESIEGSLASVTVRADRPGTIWCTLSGTGQSLYLAAAGSTLMVTSEVYGSVEMTRRYWPLDRARPTSEADGDAAVVLRIELDAEGRPKLERLAPQPGPVEPEFQLAEITTRDIDRQGFTHFFRKELEEAVDSARKTIAGSYERTSASAKDPGVDFSQLYDRHPSALLDGIRRRQIRRFVFIGQGSAHVAGTAAARFLADVAGHRGVLSLAMTAGEFSAHELRPDLSATCVVAISQSGTTTDTNRCVMLARKRGAKVIGIVNRRNSALVDLCDAVLYTSDGRDVEMAVASTKAFYSQVAAGFLLSQHVGLLVAGVVPSQACAALAELERLPEVMAAAFGLEPAIARCAREVGLKRRHWSLLGTGPSMATADEIRIKYSELCYKSVSVDYLENKKHIDLSAEPLILAALPDLRKDLISDAAKEVSVFAAHRAITVVFCDREGDAYRPYTPYVFEIPPISYGLSVVTTAILGHLFAYHTAIAMDEVSQRLRRLRKALIHSDPSQRLRSSVRQLYSAVAEEARNLLEELTRGDFNALWPAHLAADLGMVFRILDGDVDVAEIGPMILTGGGTLAGIEPWCQDRLSKAIAEATRSIDSIRHQAKTITVGTSRSGYSKTSVLERTLSEIGIHVEDLEPSFHRVLTAVDDILEGISSGIRYALVKPAGNEESQLRVVSKFGKARLEHSRFESGAPIAGTKLACVRRRQPMVVTGIRDDARLLVFPILKDGLPVELVLLHLKVRRDASPKHKLRFLQAFPHRAEQLLEHFEEILGRRVEVAELTELGTETLVFAQLSEIEAGLLAGSSREQLVSG